MRLRRCVLTAASVQCAWLCIGSDGALPWRVLLGVMCAVLLIAPLFFRRHELQTGPAMALVSGGLGGLGMLCGTLLDRLGAAFVVPPCHAAMSGMIGAQASWMNGLMFAACIPSCLWLCPVCGCWLSRVYVHAVTVLGMFAGMQLGSRVLWRLAGSARWARYSGSMHLAMLVGMMFGTLAAYIILARWAVPRERA